MDRAALLHKLRDERAKWDELLARLSADQQLQSERLGAWSVKDLIAHIAYYEARAGRRIARVMGNDAQDNADRAMDSWPRTRTYSRT